MESVKLNTKPETKINTRVVGPAMPGSFVVKDGKFIPDPNDPVNKAREAKKNELKKNTPNT